MAAKPFTLKHFKAWAAGLELDNDENWALEPFQEQFVQDVFSGKPVCWLVIPQGNGKTTLVAGLGLYFIEHQEFARVYVAAATRDQATNACFGQMNAFVVRSDLGQFTPQEGHRRVLCRSQHSRIQVFAADEGSGDGIIPTLCIIDELHRHKTLGFYRTWRGKLKKRNGQMIVISTAGEPGSEFEEQRKRMRQMAEEVERGETFTRALGESFVLHDWAVPENGDSDDLDLVARANPLSTVGHETLREERESPDWNFQHWRRLTCNLPTRSESAAITEDEWFSAHCEDQIPDGIPVDIGIDLGWKHDTTAIQPLWCRDAEFRLLAGTRVLVPPRNGNTLHPDKIKNALLEISERNPIARVVMDISNGMDIADWIEDEFGIEVMDHNQKNSQACDDYVRFMEALRQGWLVHDGNPDLTRHALNAIARPATYGDLRFDRPSDSRTSAEKQNVRVIDALVAAAMVHSVASSELAGGEASFAFV